MLLVTDVVKRRYAAREVDRRLSGPEARTDSISETPETPCESCVSVRCDCTYPVRDRNITVSEAYLKSLQQRASQPVADSQLPTTATVHTPPSTGHETDSFRRDSTTRGAAPFDNSTTENFVSGLRKMGTHDVLAPIEFPPKAGSARHVNGQPLEHVTSASRYDYFHVNSDELCTNNYIRPVSVLTNMKASNITIKLPPYPYAIQLVSQFEAYVGFEYHWYLRQTFRQKLDDTYKDSSSLRAQDRTWLCQLLCVLALGESYNSHEVLSIQVTDYDVIGDPNSETDGKYSFKPPGTTFFEQAMSIFKMPSEHPTMDHVQALNLIVGSQSLNPTV